MGPVRIKYWGLMWLTRRTYVILQSIALGLCLVLMAAGLLTMLLAGAILPKEADLVLFVGLFVFLVGLLALIAEGIETYVMLRKFTRAEAEQQGKLAALAGEEPASSAPSSTAVQLPANVPPPNTNIQP